MSESEKIEDSELEISDILESPDENYEKQRKKLDEINRKEVEKLKQLTLQGLFLNKIQMNRISKSLIEIQVHWWFEIDLEVFLES